MTAIRFCVRMKPVGQNRAKATVRGGHGAVYADPKSQGVKDDLIRAVQHHAPAKPFDGPLSIIIHAVMPMPKAITGSEKKLRQALSGAIACDKKPDNDNIEKLVWDALCGVFYLDDKQIIHNETYKFYGETPCIHVTITEVDFPIMSWDRAKPHIYSALGM